MSSNNELENTILDRFPYPIANCYYRFINIEESGTSKFGILLDVAESYLHYLATVLLSVYAVETKPHTDLTIRLIEKFRKGQWGCGDYVEMIREISRFYQSSPDQLPYPQLTHFVKNYLKEIEELAQIRNKQWGHLSGKSDAFHASILLETQSKVEFLLQQSDWLGNCPLWLPRETNEEQTLIIKADNYQSSRMLKGRSVNISIHPDDITKQHIILKRTFLLMCENKKYWILFPITLYVQQHNIGQLLLLQNLDWQSKNKNQLKKLTYINYEPLCPNYEAKEPDILQALQSKILSLLQSLPLDKQMAFDKTIVTKELINPYKGLDVFNVKDKPLFFGRDNINQTILEQLKHQPLVVLIGSSGSGKSSLIQAGICANLSPNDWYYTQPCHFGKYPLSNLQSVLELNTTISDEHDLINAIQQLVKIHHKRLLLIIDPFEELFVQNDQETQKEVIEILLKTLQYFHHEPVFRMLIGIRADFFELFKTAFTDYPVTWLPSLTKQQFIEIIEEPAKQTGLNLESGLTDRIITDLGFSEKSKSDEITNRLGLLPLIEFALSKLFDESKQQGKLTHENYRKIHGVNGALIEHIKSQLNQLNSEEQVELPRLLLSLISIKEEGFGRQKRFIADLDELQRQLAQKLITARLLVSHQESVELAHEALIQHWEELQGWITKYKEFKQWQQKLQQAVQDWQLNHQENTDLWRGARLNEAELKIKGYEHWLSSIEKAFIQASIVLRQTELLTKQRQQRRLKLLTTVALIIAIVAGFFYFQAEEQKDIANQQRNEALKTQSLFLAELSHQELGRGNATIAASLALEGLPTQWDNQENPLDRLFIHQAVDSLYSSLIPSFKESLMFQHKDVIKNVIFSSNGQQILTASKDKTAKLWDIQTGGLLHIFKHNGQVTNAVFSPDNQQILTGSEDETAKLWNIQTGNLLLTFKHDSNVRSANFSPDGKQILTASDKTAKLWDAQTENLLLTFKHDEDVKNAAFSPDGKQILTASKDKTAKLWDIQTESLSQTFKHDDQVTNAVFNHNGQQIITTSSDNTAKLWNIQTGNLLQNFQGHPMEGGEKIIFSPNGQQALITYPFYKRAKLWDIQTGNLLQTFKHNSKTKSATFSSDGKQIVTSSLDKTAKLWDAQTGNLIYTFYHEEGLINALFRPNSQQILTISENEARLWDEKTDGILQAFTYKDGVETAVFSPNTQQMLTTAFQGKDAILRDAYTGKILQIFKHNEKVENTMFSPNAQQILTTCKDRNVRLWDIQTGKLLQTFIHDKEIREIKDEFDEISYQLHYRVNGSFSPDGQRVLTTQSDSTKLWDIQTGKMLQVFVHKREKRKDVISNVDVRQAPARAFVPASSGIVSRFSPNGQYIFTSFRLDGETAKLWNAQTGEVSQLFQHRGATDVIFSPNGQQILTLSFFGNLADLWDIQSGKLLQTFKHKEIIKTIYFHSNSKQILTSSYDKTAKLWDIQTGKTLQVFQHEKDVEAAMFSPNEQKIFTISDDVVKLWDTKTGKQLQTFKQGKKIVNASFNPNNQQLFTVSNEIVKLWKIFPTTQELINYAKEQLPLVIDGESPPRRRTLTCEERQRFFLSLPKECTALSQSIEKE